MTLKLYLRSQTRAANLTTFVVHKLFCDAGIRFCEDKKRSHPFKLKWTLEEWTLEGLFGRVPTNCERCERQYRALELYHDMIAVLTPPKVV